MSAATAHAASEPATLQSSAVSSRSQSTLPSVLLENNSLLAKVGILSAGFAAQEPSFLDDGTNVQPRFAQPSFARDDFLASTANAPSFFDAPPMHQQQQQMPPGGAFMGFDGVQGAQLRQPSQYGGNGYMPSPYGGYPGPQYTQRPPMMQQQQQGMYQQQQQQYPMQVWRCAHVARVTWRRGRCRTRPWCRSSRCRRRWASTSRRRPCRRCDCDGWMLA